MKELPERIPVEDLLKQPYLQILCYPKTDEVEAKSRLEELRTFDITHVRLEGSTRIGGIPILGKGCVSLVVSALTPHGKAALKIRRVDANRTTLIREADLTRVANRVGVGPRIAVATRNFILMELIEGERFAQWIKTVHGKGAGSVVRAAIIRMLRDCFRLDTIGLEHGELSRAPKNILVDNHNRPYIIDFESARISRRASNVTSLSQYLFVGGGFSRRIRRFIGLRKTDDLKKALRRYKTSRSFDSFYKILNEANLHPEVYVFTH